jgi:hypothetical protein
VAIITADVSPIFRHAFRSRAAVQAIASLSSLFTFGHRNLARIVSPAFGWNLSNVTNEAQPYCRRRVLQKSWIVRPCIKKATENNS